MTKPARLYSYKAEELTLIRKSLGWSKRQAALQLGVDSATYRYYEQKGLSNGVIARKLKTYWDNRK